MAGSKQSNGKAFQLKIALVGRRSIGKTSLITALLSQGAELLQPTPLTIKPFDEKTKGIIQNNADLLRGSLRANKFDVIQGNEKSEQYALTMETPGTHPVVRAWTYALDLVFDIGYPAILFAIKDYPGGWGDAEQRDEDPEAREGWKSYEQWVKESSVLLIPVDAPVLMEASTPEQIIRIDTLLQLEVARETAKSWADARVKKKRPGLMVIAPIRCESYFADNGGKHDRSTELFEKVRDAYSELLSLVRKVDPRSQYIEIQYHPIDTIGAVEVADVQWPQEDEEFKTPLAVTYRARKPPTYSPKGADDLLIALNKHLLDYWGAEKNAIIEDIDRRWSEWDKSWSNFWDFVTNLGNDIRQIGDLMLDLFRGEVVAFSQALDYCNEREYGERVVTDFELP